MAYSPNMFTGGASIPAGIICMWSGTLAAVPSGWALCDGTAGTPDLRDRFIKGWAAGVDPGATGGANSASYTPAGTVAAPVFTGTPDSLTHSGTAVADHAAHTHSVTSNVTAADHAAHTHSVTSNVTAADHASHTHTYTEVPNHVHVQSVNSATAGGLSGYTPDTSTNTSVSSGYSTANPTGGVATGTTNGPNATMTHTLTNNSVTSGNPSATLTHTLTNNAVTSGNPSATLTHSVTQANAHSYTPAGTNNAPAFTGTNASIPTEPSYFKLAYIMKT